jgi:predicted NBD/HSP70 family sugar kinase
VASRSPRAQAHRPEGPTDTSGGPILSPRRVGDVNRSRILQTLVDHGPLSRAELSRFANVTRATIGNIVQSLIDAGILEEQAFRPGQIGKPARPLWFARHGALSAVVALEEHDCRAALVDATGRVVVAQVVAYPGVRPSTSDLRQCVQEALAAVCDDLAGASLLGVGVAVPAMCLTTGEIVACSVLPALEGRWLFELLSETYDVPVVIDTDSRAQALAEKWFGQGRGVQVFAAVRISEGIGAGVVLNGTVFRADQGIGSEFGHTVVAQNGGLPCRCGRSGCWQTVAGTDWIRREARLRGIKGAAKLDCAGLVLRAADDLAVAVLLADYADNIAVGLTNLMHVYHPLLFILNGDVLGGGEPLRAAVEHALRKRVVAVVRQDVRVVLSQLDSQASLQGAAALVLSARFQLAV